MWFSLKLFWLRLGLVRHFITLGWALSADWEEARLFMDDYKAGHRDRIIANNVKEGEGETFH